MHDAWKELTFRSLTLEILSAVSLINGEPVISYLLVMMRNDSGLQLGLLSQATYINIAHPGHQVYL